MYILKKIIEFKVFTFKKMTKIGIHIQQVDACSSTYKPYSNPGVFNYF